MDKIRGAGSSPAALEKPSFAAEKPQIEKKDPQDIVLEYVCSKGDRESHSIKDSFTAVREHEERHIQEYHGIAQNLGLKVVNPHISVFSEFFPELGVTAATGGFASCQFTALIDGEEVIIPVSKDGIITDAGIVKKLETEKKRREGLLPQKDEKEIIEPGTKTKQESGKPNKVKDKQDKEDLKAGMKISDPESFLIYPG